MRSEIIRLPTHFTKSPAPSFPCTAISTWNGGSHSRWPMPSPHFGHLGASPVSKPWPNNAPVSCGLPRSSVRSTKKRGSETIGEPRAQLRPSVHLSEERLELLRSRFVELLEPSGDLGIES